MANFDTDGVSAREIGGHPMPAQVTSQPESILPPPQPPDRPGTRPALNLPRMAKQVRWIQEKLARERAERGGRAHEGRAHEGRARGGQTQTAGSGAAAASEEVAGQ
jgi:hypothetical protein